MAENGRGDVVLHVPLHRQFRYIHEPLPAGDHAIPVLGHETLVESLKERLTYSHGGAFLVSGFRGVGKSTLVLRALAEASGQWGSRDVLLVAHLNVARSMTADQLLFAVVRRIFEALDDRNLLMRLPREVQHSLLLAYSRTSLSFTQTQSESTERGTTLGLAPQHRLAPTMSFSGRKTRSQATEAAFLAYSETDVEHDLVRIIQLLNGSEGRSEPIPRSLWHRRKRRSGRVRVHPVVVLDEVDKLTDNQQEAIAEFEGLLGRIKNVLTARGAHFIVVAGPDLHDRAIQDADRGNGVYESVFGWRTYVPCLFESPQRLLNGVTETPRDQQPVLAGPPQGPAPVTGSTHAPPGTVEVPSSLTAELRLDQFMTYLRFKARGVPRRLLQEFNSFVVWDDGAPALSVGEADWPRIDFYASLESVVSSALAVGAPDGLTAVAIDDDRRLLGGYHVADWALRSEGRPFTTTDVTGTSGLDPLLKMAPPTVERLLRHLVQAGVLDVVSEANRPDATRYGGSAGSTLAYYKLSDPYKRQLASFVRSSESERADLGVVTPAPPPGMYDTTLTGRSEPLARPVPTGVGRPSAGEPRAFPSAAPIRPPATAAGPVGEAGTPPVGVLAGRYEMSSLLGQGGMGAVYRGRDLLSGKEVAIKVLHGAARNDEKMLARFGREARVSRQLTHPQIVRTFDVLEGPDTEPALIMELVEGPSLWDVLSERGVLPVGFVVRIGRQLGQALDFVESVGISRIDLKPSNVLLNPERGAVIVDLGIARPSAVADDAVTMAGEVIGTPGYMAPEQVRGQAVDIRTDLYTLGILMYQCLAGSLPWSASDTFQILYQIANEDVSVDDLPVSPALRTLLGKTLSRTPASRPQSPDAFLAALAATPEAQEEVGLEVLGDPED